MEYSCSKQQHHNNQCMRSCRWRNKRSFLNLNIAAWRRMWRAIVLAAFTLLALLIGTKCSAYTNMHICHERSVDLRAVEMLSKVEDDTHAIKHCLHALYPFNPNASASMSSCRCRFRRNRYACLVLKVKMQIFPVEKCYCREMLAPCLRG